MYVNGRVHRLDSRTSLASSKERISRDEADYQSAKNQTTRVLVECMGLVVGGVVGGLVAWQTTGFRSGGGISFNTTNHTGGNHTNNATAAGVLSDNLAIGTVCGATLGAVIGYVLSKTVCSKQTPHTDIGSSMSERSLSSLSGRGSSDGRDYTPFPRIDSRGSNTNSQGPASDGESSTPRIRSETLIPVPEETVETRTERTPTEKTRLLP